MQTMVKSLQSERTNLIYEVQKLQEDKSNVKCLYEEQKRMCQEHRDARADLEKHLLNVRDELEIEKLKY